MNEQDRLSISAWVSGLKAGDAQALQQLWERFFDHLLRLAQAKLCNRPQAVLDPEDVVVSVFESLWRGAQEGRFADVRNRDDLWWLLLALTRQKVANHLRREGAQKRGGETVIFSLTSDKKNGYDIAPLISEEPSPEYLLILEEEYSRALHLLRDDELRQIAVLNLEGYTIQETSQRLKISTASVARKLRLIRSTWIPEIEQ